MSKLKELIDKLCPDGVEYKKLGDLGVFESIGVDKKTIEGQPLVTLLNYVDVYKNTYIDNSIPKMIVSASTKKVNACTCEKGDIFITPTSETKDDIGHASVITETLINTVYSYHIMRFRLIEFNMTTSFFIRYLFESNFIQKQIYRLAKGLTRFGLSKYDFAKIEIPLPPIEVQEEIVRILDNFTKCTAELQAELQAREEQYEYYRNKLLSFEGRTDVEYKKLGDIGKICMCKRILKEQTSLSGDVPFFKIGTFGGEADAYISQELFDTYKAKYSYPKKGDILISASGTIGRAVVFDGCPSYFQDSNIVWLKHDESVVLNSYLKYCYSLNPWTVSTGGTIARLYNDNILNAVIPVPSLTEQERIVNILDKFETLVKDLSQGLPAEIEARQNQYEFYRNRLLSFKRLTT